MAKTILLVDAVEWDPVYPVDHFLRNVPSWFQRHFADRSDVSWRIATWEQVPSAADLKGVDGVMVSGSPRDAWASCPENEQFCGLAGHCVETDIPFLGVCYGHQILGRTLGAKVGRHPEGLQLGPVLMTLTEAGCADPLFSGMGREFEALSGHADYVADVPEGAVLLASGGVTRVQAFRLAQRQYGVQFHPEMGADVLGFLWRARIESWKSKVPFDLAARIESFHDTPVATKVLANFVDNVV